MIASGSATPDTSRSRRSRRRNRPPRRFANCTTETSTRSNSSPASTRKDARPGSPDSVLPPLLRTIVAVDAFTHIFTNPVLAAQVREAAFPKDVAHLMRDTGGVAGLMARNSQGPVKAVPRFALPS